MRAIFNLLQNSMQSVASDSASGQSHSHSHSSIQSHSQSPIDPEDDPHNRVRAVFVSDVHLGTQGCQAEALLDFLKHHPSEYLYLVGDIVDGWQLKRRWFWPQAHNDVIQKLLRRVRKGDRVIFVPGNHDEFARAFVASMFNAKPFIPPPMASACGLPMAMILMESFNTPNGWLTLVTMPMNSPLSSIAISIPSAEN